MEKPHKTDTSTRPPIVAVLGHVDHGKTTLLDTIRKSHVTESEAGGITQHIGAYQIEVASKSKAGKKTTVPQKRYITFIDTPGHEAFAKMRARGAQVADIAVLVVAANDGVMPQTIESIKYITVAKVPFVVALNKTDLPDINVDKVKQQLAQNNVLVEGFGGDIVVAPVSAKTGKGVPELLELLLLVAEMQEIKADGQAPLSGVIIESKNDKFRGPLATVIVKNGTLKLGQTVYAETIKAKVRALVDDHGKRIDVAPPGFPVEVMGWESVPVVGSLVSESPIQSTKEATKSEAYSFELPPIDQVKRLKILLKSDVAGSLEVISDQLGDKVDIVHSATGEILESDVLMAKSTQAVIIGFNVKVNAAAQKLATTERVRIRTYAIVYELLDEITEVVDLLNKPQDQDQELGQAKILAEFMFTGQRVAGCKVLSGRLSRGDLVKIMREDQEIGRGRIKSIRHGKEDINKAEVNSECGVLLDKKLDFKLGDLIIAYKLHELLA